MKDLGGDLILSGMTPEVRDAFELLEYDKVFKLFPSVDEALKQGFAAAVSPA